MPPPLTHRMLLHYHFSNYHLVLWSNTHNLHVCLQELQAWFDHDSSCISLSFVPPLFSSECWSHSQACFSHAHKMANSNNQGYMFPGLYLDEGQCLLCKCLIRVVGFILIAPSDAICPLLLLWKVITINIVLTRSCINTWIGNFKVSNIPCSISQSCKSCRIWYQSFPGLPGRRQLFLNSYVSHRTTIRLKSSLLYSCYPFPCSTMLAGLKCLHFPKSKMRLPKCLSHGGMDCVMSPPNPCQSPNPQHVCVWTLGL